MVSGYCGNKAATFPLQLLGFDVDVMNTVSFSNHTGYPSWTGERATGEQLKELFKGLQVNGLAEYSHLLTGYIGSVQNLASVAEIIASMQEDGCTPFYVLDPVMGDHGQLYVQPDVIPVYKDMMKFAKAITPNQFEAEILANTKITNVQSCLDTIDILHKAGVEHVVITSVSLSPKDIEANMTCNGSQDRSSVVEPENTVCNGNEHSRTTSDEGEKETMYCVCSTRTADGGISRVHAIGFPTYDGYFTGTGDLFSAVLVARLFESLSEKESNDIELPALARACLKVVATMKAVVLRTFLAQAGTKWQTLDRKHASSAAVVRRCELQLIQSKRDIEEPDNGVVIITNCCAASPEIFDKGETAVRLTTAPNHKDCYCFKGTELIKRREDETKQQRPPPPPLPIPRPPLLDDPPSVLQTPTPQCPVNASHDPSSDSSYDPPTKAPQLTEEEFQQTWLGIPGTIKIGVLLPFTDPDKGYRTSLSRISLSVLRMAVEDMNIRQVVPGLNISLVVRDSQQPITGTNITGAAAAISATTRLLALEIGAAIGDISSELTTSEAIMTSSVGVPQCSFASYNMDVASLKSFRYLFRTVPGVLTYYEALVNVIDHYNWKRISVVYTSDVTGLMGEKKFSADCEKRGIDVMRILISNTESESAFLANIRNAIKTLRNSDSMIHVLIVSRSDMIQILDMARNNGLLGKGHVWLTAIDISDSLARLRDPFDFNGLIMGDVLWHRPGLPAYDAFVTRWASLDRERYPDSGGSQLTWHETYAYTCLQVIVEGYRKLVQEALTHPSLDERDRMLSEIVRGKRSQELTTENLAQRTYDTPVGQFRLTADGVPIDLPIRFNSGTTNIPGFAPDDREIHPNHDDPFGITMIVLTTVLLVAICITTGIVIIYRDNIIIKSASPLFCVLELLGSGMMLLWIYIWIDIPTQATCRTWLMLVTIGLTINLSALVVKNYRIYRIFNSVSVINYAVSNKFLLRVVAFPVILTLPTLVRTANEFWMVCDSEYPEYGWSIVTGLTPFLLNLFGIYLAFKTRNVTRLWNEARAIAATIYLVSFFFIIIIIVQTFSTAQYDITYHVTLACVYTSCLLEYLVLFYPKLRNLFLQRRGRYVPTGRADAFMDGILGGTLVPEHSRDTPGNSADLLRGDNDGLSRHIGQTASRANFDDSRRGSDTSRDMQHNPNISDLISSYPFGQLNGEYGGSTTNSPVQAATMYGASSLTNRIRRGSSDQSSTLEHFDTLGTLSPPSGVNPSTANRILGSRRGVKRRGSDTVSPGQRTKDSKNASHLYDVHEAFLAASNNRPGHRRSLGGVDSCFQDAYATPDYGGGGTRSRENSVGDYHVGNGLGNRHIGYSRSPKVNPLQLSSEMTSSSSRHSIRERRIDSYTVIVPVQRKRWYLMSIFAQWRMSKIIFVPHSKVLVIVDLESEKSSSLIVHAIEQGYSVKDALKAEKRRRRPSSSSVTIPLSKERLRASTVDTTFSEHPATPQADSTEIAKESTVVPLGMESATRLNMDQIAPNEIAESDLHPSVTQLSRPLQTPCPAGAQPSVATSVATYLAHSNAMGDKEEALRGNFSTSSEAVTLANHPAGTDATPRPGIHSLSSLPIINNVRRISLNFEMDMRNLEGIPIVSDANEDGPEVTIDDDYIVRIISIHNECWRVQLPDHESMERWLDIGRQIKDENWISSHPVNGPSTKKRRKESDASPGAVTGLTASTNDRRRDIHDGKATSTIDGPLTTSLGLQPTKTRTPSVVHSLGYQFGTYFAGDTVYGQSEHQRAFADQTNCLNDTEERQIGRRRAALMNQKLKESYKANKIFSSYRPDLLGDAPREESSRSSRTGSLEPFTSRMEHEQHHHLHRIASDLPRPRRASHLGVEILPSSLTGSARTSSPVQEMNDPTGGAVVVVDCDSSENASVRDRKPDKVYVNTKILPTFGKMLHRNQTILQNNKNERANERANDDDDDFNNDGEFDFQVEMSAVNGAKDSQDDVQYGDEDAYIRDVLAETRVTYTNGQHAMYDIEAQSGPEYRHIRHVNSIQYDYDKDRSRQGNRQSFDNEFPTSPEWHLTSSDVPDLDLKHGVPGIGASSSQQSELNVISDSAQPLDNGMSSLNLTVAVVMPADLVTESLAPVSKLEGDDPVSPSAGNQQRSPLISKFDAALDRRHPTMDANTIEMQANPVQAQAPSDRVSGLQRAIGPN
ncbi:hypothetical protein BG004_005625 [Podila humilis]|nr:hypothetical protein BG004_005625 [Podila humilis]